MAVNKEVVLRSIPLERDRSKHLLEAAVLQAGNVMDAIEVMRSEALLNESREEKVEMKNPNPMDAKNRKNDLRSIMLTDEKLDVAILKVVKAGDVQTIMFRRIPLDTEEARNTFFADMHAINNVHGTLRQLSFASPDTLPPYIYVQEAQVERVTLWNRPDLETQLTALFVTM
jgi:hypothetical protein